jgi:hypothetical protein
MCRSSPAAVYGGTWNLRQYFLLEMRLANHSLKRCHRLCPGAPGMNVTVHQAFAKTEHTPHDLGAGDESGAPIQRRSTWL